MGLPQGSLRSRVRARTITAVQGGRELVWVAPAVAL